VHCVKVHNKNPTEEQLTIKLAEIMWYGDISCITRCLLLAALVWNLPKPSFAPQNYYFLILSTTNTFAQENKSHIKILYAFPISPVHVQSIAASFISLS
jgi:hypothetical protein